jgi:RNA-binding protein
MLTSKNKAFLRKASILLAPSLNLGKGAVDAAIVAAVNAALEAHELIKIRVLANSASPLDVLAKDIAEKTQAETVAIIGRVIILYRPRKKDPAIIL